MGVSSSGSRLLQILNSILSVVGTLRELLAEPRWIVELTASTGTPTSLTVPEWIIGIEDMTPSLSTSGFTEVVLTDEGRYSYSV